MQLYLTVLTLSASSAVLAAVPTYGQCGGSTYKGDTACAAGSACKAYNPYYSQCVPGAANGGSPAPPPAASSAAAPTTLLTRSSVVVAPSTASSVAAAAPTTSAGNIKGSGANGAQCSIDAAFKAKGKKYIGVAADSGTLRDATNAQVIKDNFGQVTPENSYVIGPCTRNRTRMLTR
jgi:endo-1,4-beta-xylanase